MSSRHDGNNDSTAGGQGGASEKENHPKTSDCCEYVADECYREGEEAGEHSQHRAQFKGHDPLSARWIITFTIDRTWKNPFKYTWVL